MGQVEVATLAVMTRSRRQELGLTRNDCHAAGGPPVATLAAVERGQLTKPTEEVLGQLDTALRWPQGTARAAVTAPVVAVSHAVAVRATVGEHKLLYRELVRRGAASEVVAVAGAMLARPLRAELRGRLDEADVDTLLAVDALLAVRRAPRPAAACDGKAGRREPAVRSRRPTPHVDNEVGEAISLRDLRLNRGWSLGDVVGKINALQQVSGERAVVSKGTLSAIESGSRGMSAQMATQLELVYSLTPGALAVYAGRRSGLVEGRAMWTG